MTRNTFDHLDAGAAVLSDLIDVGALHQSQANVCMPQAVRRARSAFSVDAELFLVEDSFEKLSLPLGKNQIVGSGVRHCALGTAGVSDVPVGAFAP